MCLCVIFHRKFEKIVMVPWYQGKTELFPSKACQNGLVSYLSNGWVLFVVQAEKFCQSQEQFSSNWSISVDTSNKTDLWFFGLRYVGLIGDFEGPDVTIFGTLSQTFENQKHQVSKSSSIMLMPTYRFLNKLVSDMKTNMKPLKSLIIVSENLKKIGFP